MVSRSYNAKRFNRLSPQRFAPSKRCSTNLAHTSGGYKFSHRILEGHPVSLLVECLAWKFEQHVNLAYVASAEKL
jgi:hypothetical protein